MRNYYNKLLCQAPFQIIVLFFGEHHKLLRCILALTCYNVYWHWPVRMYTGTDLFRCILALTCSDVYWHWPVTMYTGTDLLGCILALTCYNVYWHWPVTMYTGTDLLRCILALTWSCWGCRRWRLGRWRCCCRRWQCWCWWATSCSRARTGRPVPRCTPGSSPSTRTTQTCNVTTR